MTIPHVQSYLLIEFGIWNTKMYKLPIAETAK